MYRHFFLLVSSLFLISAQGYAQKSHVIRHQSSKTVRKPVPGDDTPFPGPVLIAEKFLGTWQWTSNDQVFVIELSRNQRYPLPNGQTTHFIVGHHYYARNGTVIESSFSQDPTLLGQPAAGTSISLTYKDLTRNKWGWLDLTIDTSTPDQMTFTLKPREGMVHNGNPVPKGFTIPSTLVLTRVN